MFKNWTKLNIYDFLSKIVNINIKSKINKYQIFNNSYAIVN